MSFGSVYSNVLSYYFLAAILSSLKKIYIQGDFESCADILITSYWLHVELGKIFLKNSGSKNKMTNDKMQTDDNSVLQRHTCHLHQHFYGISHLKLL
jgi:hypothetical protein